MKKINTTGIVASLLLIMALTLSVILGADTRAWAWGSAMVLLGLSLAVAAFLPNPGRPGKVWFAVLLASLWFIARAATSPVLDFARSDAFLALIFFGGATASCFLARIPRALGVFSIGLALLLLMNVAVAMVQGIDPSFSWPYQGRPKPQPSGFFGHYNYFANFAVGATGFLAARLFFTRISIPERGFLGFAVLGGIAGVILSGSRGAILGAGVCFAVFTIGGALLLWRNRSRTSAKVGLILAPLILILGVVAAQYHVDVVIEKRSSAADEGMTDNISRFNYYELALDTWSENPWIGGGSSSFSWLRNSYWDVQENGGQSSAEPHVHNELLQAMTDYGLVGAVLGLTVVGLFIWSGIATLVAGAERGDSAGAEWICLGALSGGLGVLTQANVSFVFHLSPAVLLVGIYCGLVQGVSGVIKDVGFSRTISSLSRIAACLLALPIIAFGALGTWIHHQVWPLAYARTGASLQVVEDRITSTMKLWPGFQLPKMWASMLHNAADKPSASQQELLNTAIFYYREAADHHPYDPSLEVNQANALSALGRNTEAAKAYQRGIELQGTLENAYHARFEWARHIYRNSYLLWVEERRPEEALAGFHLAYDELLKTGPDAGEYFRRGEGRQFLEQLQQAISFLEDAGIQPAEEAPDFGG